MRIVLLASGSGSLAQSIIDARGSGKLKVEILELTLWFLNCKWACYRKKACPKSCDPLYLTTIIIAFETQ
jgi:folate-dependent phosphoribosylglycinamide formyltransferase PurN